MIELIFGTQKKEQFYEETFYFGYFRNQFGLLGQATYRQMYRKTRRPRVVPLMALARLNELDIVARDLLSNHVTEE